MIKSRRNRNIRGRKRRVRGRALQGEYEVREGRRRGRGNKHRMERGATGGASEGGGRKGDDGERRAWEGGGKNGDRHTGSL